MCGCASWAVRRTPRRAGRRVRRVTARAGARRRGRWRARRTGPPRVSTRTRVVEPYGVGPHRLVRARSASVTAPPRSAHELEQRTADDPRVGGSAPLVGEQPPARPRGRAAAGRHPPRAAGRRARDLRARSMVITGASIRRHSACADGMTTPSRASRTAGSTSSATAAPVRLVQSARGPPARPAPRTRPARPRSAGAPRRTAPRAAPSAARARATQPRHREKQSRLRATPARRVPVRARGRRRAGRS